MPRSILTLFGVERCCGASGPAAEVLMTIVRGVARSYRQEASAVALLTLPRSALGAGAVSKNESMCVRYMNVNYGHVLPNVCRRVARYSHAWTFGAVAWLIAA
jgi:hypothetical protein